MKKLFECSKKDVCELKDCSHYNGHIFNINCNDTHCDECSLDVECIPLQNMGIIPTDIINKVYGGTLHEIV